MKSVYIIAIALACYAYLPVSATIINIPGDHPTIQDGINASTDGDTVLVQPGTYVENINFQGHNIVLGSLFLTTGDTDYISSTIINSNGYGYGSVVSFFNGEDNSAVITGFTIQNGYTSWGGGIHCLGNSNPMISYNTISGNSAIDFGGGILCDNSSPTIDHNTISGNSAGIDGGGIYCHDSDPTISNNTISGNSADFFGGGIHCWDSNPVITNTIFWADSAPGGSEISLEWSFPVITYCDVQGGWAGDGNIDCDPEFCFPDTGNYYLTEGSCCLGGGEGGADIGAFGQGCCPYIAGDVNYNTMPFELVDVMAMIRCYHGAPPYYTCDCPPHGSDFPATADPNGNCVANELNDVVTEIAAYRGSTTVSGCIDCPVSGR